MTVFRGALNIKRRPINSLKQLLITLVLVVSVMELVGCEEKGFAGKIGEQLDKSVKDAAKKTNELLGK
jgi:hypothetical protein